MACDLLSRNVAAIKETPILILLRAITLMDVLNTFLTNYFSHFKQNETKRNLAGGAPAPPDGAGAPHKGRGPPAPPTPTKGRVGAKIFNRGL